MIREGDCPYCKVRIRIDTEDEYVQCNYCGYISKIKIKF